MAQLGGIWCPWNKPGKNRTGPAQMGEEGVFCLVWKNWDDFNDKAADNNFNYCRKICQYGHQEAGKRHNAERAKKAFHARKFQRETFAEKVKKQFTLQFPQLEVRMIAPWKHHVKPKPLKPTRFGHGGKLLPKKKFKLPEY